jgi:anti-sigma factor RsiW
MKHPSQATLALHAGGDLGFFARWRADRHLAKCESCREEVASFEAMREILPDLAEIPEIPWNRMAAEMKANIRLGLAAGECVRTGELPLRETPFFAGARAVIAVASIVVLMVTGLVLEHPAPAVADDGMVVQTTANGIQLRKGRQAVRLMNTGARNVNYSVDAQGGMRARYVDPETGILTINNVYAE